MHLPFRLFFSSLMSKAEVRDELCRFSVYKEKYLYHLRHSTSLAATCTEIFAKRF